MDESELQKVNNYPIYPRDCKICSHERFLNIDNGSQGGTQWTCFIKKITTHITFNSFGGQADKLLLNQLAQPMTYHNYKIQDINSKLSGSYCLYFFCLIEGMNFYGAIFKMN